MLDATQGSAPKLNPSQFGKTLGAAAAGPVGMGAAIAAPKIAQGIKAAAPIAGKAIGNVAKAGMGAGAALGRAGAGALGTAAKVAPLAGPVGMAGAAAYGAAHTPGGKSIVQGAIKGAGGPNMGLGVAGAPLGAIKGAMNSKGFGNVASGAAKGGLIGAIGGPVGSAIGAGIGAIGGLFSHRGMGQQAAPKPGAAVPNRAGGAYTVKKGDTLSSIATANKTTVDALRKANPQMTAPGSKYKNGNMIWSGTKVNLK